MTLLDAAPRAAHAEAWRRLEQLVPAARATRLSTLFSQEPDRVGRLTRRAAGLTLDASKQHIDAAALTALHDFADAAGAPARIADLFAGAIVNPTENRPALHMALRAPLGEAVRFEGEPVDAVAAETAARVKAFAEAVRSGAHAGAAGRPLRAVVHIGIGGSDLGPRLVLEALWRRRDPAFTARFAANIDPADINDALDGLDPDTTLVAVVSKSFTTQETMANAAVAREWLVRHVGEDGLSRHLVAITAKPDRAAEFGVGPDAVFAFRDWVGGRYSVWSPVSLALEIVLGPETMAEFRAGAAAMDAHVRTAPPGENMALLKALTDVWNRSVLGRPTRAVIPYSKRLRLLPAYLQQLEMESNGKGVTLDGQPVSAPTSSVVWGAEGANAQHAFFQQLHQGPDIVPMDAIGVLEDQEARPDMHRALLANMFAQTEALMAGRSTEAAREELIAGGMDALAADGLAPHKTFPGDRPSTTILLDALDPGPFGALIALHEHKVFLESVFWGINAFDQWGVELGKVLAKRILGELEGGPAGAHDASTAALIASAKG